MQEGEIHRRHVLCQASPGGCAHFSYWRSLTELVRDQGACCAFCLIGLADRISASVSLVPWLSPHRFAA